MFGDFCVKQVLFSCCYEEAMLEGALLHFTLLQQSRMSLLPPHSSHTANRACRPRAVQPFKHQRWGQTPQGTKGQPAASLSCGQSRGETKSEDAESNLTRHSLSKEKRRKSKIKLGQERKWCERKVRKSKKDGEQNGGLSAEKRCPLFQ